MRNLILYLAMSLDGYIADRDGGVGWLVGQEPGKHDMGSYPEFIQTVDTVLMGHTTFHQIATELFTDGWPYQDMQTYVLTHRKLEDRPGITFTAEPPDALLTRLRQQPGKHIWLCGGADLARQYAQADLIDRYHFTLIPTVLGGGVRLFDEGLPERRLRLLRIQASNGMADLIYERRE